MVGLQECQAAAEKNRTEIQHCAPKFPGVCYDGAGETNLFQGQRLGLRKPWSEL